MMPAAPRPAASACAATLAAATLLFFAGCSAQRASDPAADTHPGRPEAARPAAGDAAPDRDAAPDSEAGTEDSGGAASGVDFAAFGLPAYPNARPIKRQGTLRMGVGAHSVTLTGFLTDDGPEAVADWLAQRLKVEHSMTTAQGGTVAGTNERGDRIVAMMQRKPSDTATTVMLRKQSR